MSPVPGGPRRISPRSRAARSSSSPPVTPGSAPAERGRGRRRRRRPRRPPAASARRWRCSWSTPASSPPADPAPGLSLRMSGGPRPPAPRFPGGRHAPAGMAEFDAVVKTPPSCRRRPGAAPMPFTAEHDALRESIRAFVTKELRPHAAQWEHDEWFADWVFPRMGELGLLGLRYPEQYGGQGGDYFSALVLSEEMAGCGSGGVGMAVAVQTEMATPPIFKFGTEAQKQQYLVPA